MFFAAMFVSRDFCQAATSGTISMTIPNAINAGDKLTVPLWANIYGGMIGSWLVDILMDPNYIMVAGDSDIVLASSGDIGYIPNAFILRNYNCANGSGNPTCNVPSGMQVARVGGLTTNTSVTGDVILAKISFTGVASSRCGTVMKIIPRDFTDSTLGAPAPFSPMPSEVDIAVQGAEICDLVAPSAPSSLDVL